MTDQAPFSLERPLSFAQERLWFLDRYEPDSALYVLPEARRLDGALDRDALVAALSALVERHEILRTTYREGVDGPVQQIDRTGAVHLAEIDLAELDRDDREEELARLLKLQAERPFDLARDLMLRATLLRLTDREHVLLLCFHHIAIDGWSVGILFRELGDAYAAFSAGNEPGLPEPQLSYADFAVWQRETLSGEDLEREASYWEERLAGCPTLLDLPLDRARPAAQTFAGAVESMHLGPHLSSDLRQFARRNRATVYTVLLAALQVLLHKLSGQTDILIGTPVAGRAKARFEQLVGLLVNTLVQRADLSRDITFLELVRETQAASFEAYDHQQLPFEQLIDLLQLGRDLSHSPLVQVIFSLDNTPGSHSSFGPLRATRINVPTQTAKFDLAFLASDRDESIKASVEYASDLFDRETVRRWVDGYKTLLAAGVRAPQTRISELSLLSKAERELLLVEWNATDADLTFVPLVHQVEQRASASGSPTAVQHEGRALCYGEMERAASDLAGEIRALDPDGAPVGILADRSPEAIVAILGILKTGAPFVPLDRTSPPERLAFQVDEASVKLVLTDEEGPDALALASCRTLCLGGRSSPPSIRPKLVDFSPKDPFSILFTSGSTGRPKGVAMPQGAMVNLVAWQVERFRGAEGARVAQFAPLSFDVSVQEIFSTLVSGGTLVVVPESARRDPVELWDFLAQERIQRLFLPYIALEQLADVGVPDDVVLETVLCAGEQLRITPPIRRMFRNLPGCALVNHYGPTETHVVTTHELTGPPIEWPKLPPIGRPIMNTRVYVLDERRQPIPIGVRGELYIGGDCLSLGYVDRPRLTAERFVANPFDPHRSSRLYRTGDVVRYRRDGNLEFLGRNDLQVKIRGFRVELGEIEAALAEDPRVASVAVSSQETSAGRHLIAHVVPSGEQPNLPQDLRALARRRLPDYMVPARFVILDELPLGRSGKVDREALRSPEPTDESLESSYTAPRSAIEEQLVETWEGLLNVRPIGIHHDFFDLGGHSLLATRVMSRIETRLGVRIPLIELFRTPTIADLARLVEMQYLDDQEDDHDSGLVVYRSGGNLPPFLMVNPLPIFRPLARTLGTDQPFLAPIVPPLSTLPLDYSMADVVEPMLETLLRETREPYFIGGWCRYGMIAYELASQLAARGREVRLLALMDAYAPGEFREMSPRELRRMRRKIQQQEIWYHLNCLRQLDSRERRAYLSERAARLGSYLGSRIRRVVSRSDAGKVNRSFFDELHLNLSRYEPAPYAGPVALFKASRTSWAPPADPSWGWGSLVRSPIETHSVPGNHLTMFLEPNVAELGAKLASSLAAAAGHG